MESTETISVIINNYNYEKFLPGCIESVLQQSSAPDEIIVVDDGSTDDSCRILAAYQDRITIIFKENQGQASALNAGYIKSTCKWILFLDADDLLTTEAISELRKNLDDTYSKLHFPMWICGPTGSVHGKLPKAEAHLTRGNALTALVGEQGLHVMPTSANLFSRKYLDTVMPIPESEYRICADTYLLFNNLRMQNIGLIEKRLACYRVHSSNWYNLATQFDFDLPRNLRHLESSVKMVDLFMSQDLLDGSPAREAYLAHYLDLASLKNMLLLKRHRHVCGDIPFGKKALVALAAGKIAKIPDPVAMRKEQVSLFIIRWIPLMILPVFSFLEQSSKRFSLWLRERKSV